MWSYSTTVDEERGIAYMPMGGPAANYYGGDRKGDNVPANSVVAVDAATGKYEMAISRRFTTSCGTTILPPDPSLIDIVKDGKKIPALVQTGKSGYMFILDRVTGKPVFGVEERPVPQGNVPGERYSPTQPFPVKPPPIARVSLTRRISSRRGHHGGSRQSLPGAVGQIALHNAGPYTPWPFQPRARTPSRRSFFPDSAAARTGAARRPIQSWDIFSSLQGQPGDRLDEKGIRNTHRQPGGSGRVHRSGPQGFSGFTAIARDANGRMIGNWPCIKPPWGRLFAVNANTGDIAWQVPLGITEGLPRGKQTRGRREQRRARS